MQQRANQSILKGLRRQSSGVIPLTKINVTVLNSRVFAYCFIKCKENSENYTEDLFAAIGLLKVYCWNKKASSLFFKRKRFFIYFIPIGQKNKNSGVNPSSGRTSYQIRAGHRSQITQYEISLSMRSNLIKDINRRQRYMRKTCLCSKSQFKDWGLKVFNLKRSKYKSTAY